MNRQQIKQLNKKIDQLLSRESLPSLEELGIPSELVIKYGIKAFNYPLLAKIQRWQYGQTTHISQNQGRDLITLQEWDEYQKHRINLAKEKKEDEGKVQQELTELENLIRKGEGFMEVILTSNDNINNLTLTEL